ncbi:MAG: hypothetical protein WBV25_00165 [Methylocella sp.]
MKILIARARRKVLTVRLAAATLAASFGAVSAQQLYPAPADQVYGGSVTPNPQTAPSRWDRAHFDRSGTRGREGLGATPMRPEGPGNVSD